MLLNLMDSFSLIEMLYKDDSDQLKLIEEKP